MIQRPTVFILGAGSSKPYGFPIGTELTNLTLNSTQQGQNMFKVLTSAGFASEEIERFRIEFQRSGRYSVDAFLQNRADLSSLGRAIIAYQIMIKERHEALYESSADADWYRHLVQKMDAPFENFHENNVAFITFNYDRSLEYYLVQHLAGSFGITEVAAFNEVSKLPLIHLHGDVGALPWSKENGRSYGGKIEIHELREWAKRIHIVHDELAEREANFIRAREMLQTYEMPVFLGFGFDRINCERLKFSEITGKARGTGYGLTEAERNAIRKQYGPIPLWDRDCLGLLRNEVLLK